MADTLEAIYETRLCVGDEQVTVTTGDDQQSLTFAEVDYVRVEDISGENTKPWFETIRSIGFSIGLSCTMIGLLSIIIVPIISFSIFLFAVLGFAVGYTMEERSTYYPDGAKRVCLYGDDQVEFMVNENRSDVSLSEVRSHIVTD